MHPFSFDQWRTALVVLAGIGLAGSEQLFATFADERFVLAMRGDDDAEFLCQFERAIQFRIIHAKRSFVSEKDFERADAAFHDLSKLLLGRVIELRYAHVERKIARRLAGSLLHPKLETLQRVVLA